jgi:hypothetical protein
MGQHPPGESVDVSRYPSAEQRRTVGRVMNRTMWIIVSLLLAWLIAGIFRAPPASWNERVIVGMLTVCFALYIALSSPYCKKLPALDRRPRTAIVTGRATFNPEPDPDSFTSPYKLVTVRVDLDGILTDTMIADIVAAEDLDRFAVGSVWNVYAFEDPVALNNDPEPDRTRVILTEAHDDVIRTGYDLGFYTLHDEAGPGSDLLLRRFANDRPGKERTAR